MTVVNYFQIHDSLVLEFLCKVGFVSSFACNVMNAVTLWLMAFDRQECVLRPLDRHITTSNVKKIILATWVLALTTLVLFSISIRNEQSVCIEFFPFNNMLTELGHHKLFTILLSIVGQFDKITIVIMVVTFFRIVKALRSSVVNPSNLTLRQRQEKKLTYLTYKMLGIFLLFRVPGYCLSNGVAQDRKCSRKNNENCESRELCNVESGVRGKPNSSSQNAENQTSEAW